LFKHNNKSALSSEYWEIIKEDNSGENLFIEPIADSLSMPIDVSLPEQIINDKLASYDVSKKSFTVFDERFSSIDKKEFFLNKPYEYIKYSKDYNVLAHTSWKQAGLNENNALAVKFNFDENKTQISGDIKITLKRYLHTLVNFELIENVCRQTAIETQINELSNVKIKVQTDVNADLKTSVKQPLTGKTSPIINEADNLTCQMEKIKFKQSRKMRSKELHYIDHPVFGVLVQINPSEIEKDNITKH